MKPWKTLSIIITTLLVGAIAIYSSLYLHVSKFDNKIYPNTFINEIDISGKTRDEVYNSLEQKLSNLKDKKIIIKTGGKSYPFQLSNIKINNSIDNILNKALSEGKNLNLFSKYNLLKKGEKRNYDLLLSYNEDIKNILAKIEKEVNKTPQNAYIKYMKNSKPIIVKELPGQSLNKQDLIDKLNLSIKNNDKSTEIIAKVNKIESKITEKKLLEVNSLISSFSTSLGNSPWGRKKNIILGTSLINGTLLMPGDTFSFNNKIGKVSKERGFQEAPIIIKNRLEKGVGGGLCQVSTTLYNAITTSNIMPIERKNHSIAPTYIEPGFDATVSENSIDYKFKNTLSYPIYIESFVKNEKVIFNIYSNSSLNNTKYKLVNEIYNEVPPKTILEDDPSLPKGVVKKVQSPKNGCNANVYLIGYKNGKEVSRKLISKDIYNPSNEIIKRGIK